MEAQDTLTTPDAAALLGLSIRQFGRVVSDAGVSSVGWRHVGKKRYRLYPRTAIEYLVAERRQDTDDRRTEDGHETGHEPPPPDMSEAVALSQSLVTLVQDLRHDLAERQTLVVTQATEIGSLRERLAQTEERLQEALARLEPPPRRSLWRRLLGG